MQSTSSAPARKPGGEPARPHPTRLGVFAGSNLNLKLCALQTAIMDLGLEAEAYLAAGHEEQLRADLAAAGLEPLSYPEQVQLYMVGESLKAIAATMRLTYDVLGSVARPEYDVPAEPDAPAVATEQR